MRLGIPSGTVSDQGLCCMEGCQVRIARRIFGDTGRENDSGAHQTFPRLVEVPGGLGRHRSTPSRRISRIKGVRSS